jgi:tRNA(adenine34) deaminase
VSDDIWDGVGDPWREAFELAWESYQAGSPPVGAVVVGPDARVVARGRSRRAETAAPANQLAGSRLAHAEVNALAQLDVDQHAGHELFVTLEPCLLCWAAISIARVPKVRFAGQDPMWQFLGQISGSHPVLADRAYTVTGPLPGPMGTWATLLPLLERLERDPTGLRVDHFRRSVPTLVELARQMVADGTAQGLAAMCLDDAIHEVWDDLQTTPSVRPD